MGEFKNFLESKWNYFSKEKEFPKSQFARGQHTFPFMKGPPEFTHNADPFLDKDTINPDYEEDTDYRVYHVTTNLAGVIKTGRLLSRGELGKNYVGGLGWDNSNFSTDPPNMVSTTFDINRARKIYDDIKFVVEMVHGQVLASLAFSVATEGVYDPLEDDFIKRVVRDHLPKKVYNGLMSGEFDENVMDKYIIDNVYEFYQKLEVAVIQSEGQNEDGNGVTSVTGFANSLENMKKIDSSQIAIVQCAVKKTAHFKNVVLEKEIKFYPTDLKIIRYYKP